MLVLSRHEGERIIVWDEGNPQDKMIIEVVRLDHKTVRLGFHANRKYIIKRDELVEGYDDRQTTG